MMRPEAIAWCKMADAEYIEELKSQIAYFNQRLVVRSMAREAIAESIRKMLAELELDLKQSEEEYRRDYEDNSLQSSVQVDEGKHSFKDWCAKAADQFVANVESQNPWAPAGEDDSDRRPDIDG